MSYTISLFTVGTKQKATPQHVEEFNIKIAGNTIYPYVIFPKTIQQRNVWEEEWRIWTGIICAQDWKRYMF